MRRDAGVEERDADAAAVRAGNGTDAQQPRGPGPHLIGGRGLVRDRHRRLHRQIAGKMLDLAVETERVNLCAVRLEHRFMFQHTQDEQPVPVGNALHRVGTAMDDDRRSRVRPRCLAGQQIARDMRTMSSRQRARRRRWLILHRGIALVSANHHLHH